MSDDDAMKFRLSGRWQVDWEWDGARPIEEKPIRMLANPAFGSENLMGRCLDGSPIPAGPVKFRVAGIGIFAVFV